jgi:hypothetical protein
LPKIFTYYGFDKLIFDERNLAEAEKLGKVRNIPGWPKRGSIYDAGEYLIVNLGSE